MDADKLKASLAKGSIARLIPTLADSKKEERATSVVLAAFMVVPDFAEVVLSEAGAPIGKRTKIQCFTEVCFKGSDLKSRPDGLIIMSSGKKLWSALVETKVGKNELSQEQVENYLSVAKSQGIDAVITISNQFASLPTHHPVAINKQKLRSTSLYHFSWMSILSKALLLIESKSIQDVEQAYILRELVRYLRHDGSGIASDLRMSEGWKDTCVDVHNGAVLLKSNGSVGDAVSSWHQLQRYLSIQLSMAVGKPVKGCLSRKHSEDPSLRLQDDIADLVDNNSLSAELDIPNAAGRLELRADLLRKTLDLSMRLDAPKDTKRQTASINWLGRQLKGCKLEDVVVRAYWPRRIPITSVSAELLLESPESLIPPNVKDMPTAFSVVRVIDLGAKVKSVKLFVELAETGLVKFYSDVCQNLVRWVPKAPKVKGTESKKNSGVERNEENFLSSFLGLDSEASNAVIKSAGEAYPIRYVSTESASNTGLK